MTERDLSPLPSTRVYLRRSMDDKLDRAIEVAAKATLEEPEARAVVLCAPSGAGKTTMLNRALERNVALASARASGAGLLRIQLPSPCTLAELGRVIATKAGYPMRADLRAPVTWDAAWRAMDARKVRFLWMDEMQNVSETATKPEKAKILNSLRALLIETGRTRGLMLSGQESIVSFLQEDDSIRRRSDFLTLRPITPGIHVSLAKGVTEIASVAGIPPSAELAACLRSELIPRLSHASLYQFGTALEMTRWTVEQALAPAFVRGKALPVPTSLTMEHFAARWAAATGNAAFANPFVTPDWSKLDCRLRNVTDPRQLGHGGKPA